MNKDFSERVNLLIQKYRGSGDDFVNKVYGSVQDSIEEYIQSQKDLGYASQIVMGISLGTSIAARIFAHSRGFTCMVAESHPNKDLEEEISEFDTCFTEQVRLLTDEFAKHFKKRFNLEKEV